MAKKITIGLALGSGGARGLAHAGVLQVLEAEGLVPDYISGTSMGAIVGGLYAEDPDAGRTWERLKAYVNDDDFTSAWSAFIPRESGGEEEHHTNRFQEMMDFVQRKFVAVKTITRPWQQEEEALRRPLENLFIARNFDELRIPFATVAVDLISGRAVVSSGGDLINGLYGSCAIPAVFPPRQADGMYVVDGGAPFRVPVEACRLLGADLVIAVAIPAYEERSFKTGLDLILRSNAVARDRLDQLVLASADLVIRPDVTDFHWADFRNGLRCRERGVDAAEAVVPELRRLLALRGSRMYHLRRALARKLGFGN